MKRNALPLLCAVPLLLAHFDVVGQDIQPIWSRFDNANVDGLYGAPFVHVDGEDNVVVCSNDYNPGPLLSMLTTKYNAHGEMLWQQKFDTPGNDDPISSLCDAQNAVYVAGNTGQNSIMGGVPGMVVLKYEANGSLAWSYRYEGPIIGQNYVTKILFDAAENVVVFGNYSNLALSKTGLFAVKLSPSGQVLWSASHVDQDFGYVGVGALWLGDRWVFWGKNLGAAGTRYLAWQLADDGQTLASAQTALNEGHSPEAVHIGNDGSLYASTWIKYQVLKFGLDGQKWWEYDKPNNLPLPPQGVKARVNAIGTDSDGNVFVYGSFRETDGYRTLSSKLASNSNLVWEHKLHVNGIPPLPDKLAWLDENTMIIASTLRTNPDSNHYEFTFLLYNADGFMNVATSDLLGKKNSPSDILVGKGDFYVTGIAFPDLPPNPAKQILCKYDLSDIYKLLSNRETSVRALSFWPNPAKDWVRVNLPDKLGLNSESRIEVHDATGRLVSVQKLPIGATEVELSLEGLPSGFYMLSLRAERGGLYVGKLMKQ